MTPAEMVCQSPRCNGRLRLPKGTVGRDYVLLQLKLGGKGPFDFVVDTGLTAELITPHLKQVRGWFSGRFSFSFVCDASFVMYHAWHTQLCSTPLSVLDNNCCTHYNACGL